MVSILVKQMGMLGIGRCRLGTPSFSQHLLDGLNSLKNAMLGAAGTCWVLEDSLQPIHDGLNF
jgi:hypothetical protein